jgi:F-type H+-transporting ATPase subunit epsilon
MKAIDAGSAMNLRVLLPFAVALESVDVRRIVVETVDGSVGLWPRRLDCAAVLVPGILTYETGSGGEKFAAIDRGVLVKTGAEVVVSVRNAVTGGDLGELRDLIDEQFVQMDESERQSRSLLAKMESEIIRETTRFPHD